ncbi:MAG: PPOX class F420-dependent oxidoreductase [Ardenticatenaceae bacterium]|nr:PPOX class F420-dependent oxidoreductase [Ardenticatenaceae bacterium]MCB9444413.1 PPOX class F420-dependent oxidoreductase [Ardenticatenaceae bacterium]
MSIQIPQSHVDLLTDPVCVTLVTVMPDGQPQASVIWCDYDGQHVLVNTARGRQKERNLTERPMATILAIDPQNPYRYLEVRGRVAEATEKGAVESINSLAQQYVNQPTYYGGVAPAEQANKETRVLFKIEPIHVNAIG